MNRTLTPALDKIIKIKKQKENPVSVSGDWFNKLQSFKYYASDEKNDQLIWNWKDVQVCY